MSHKVAKTWEVESASAPRTLITHHRTHQGLEEGYVPSVHPEVPECLVDGQTVKPGRGMSTSACDGLEREGGVYIHQREKRAEHDSPEGVPKGGSSLEYAWVLGNAREMHDGGIAWSRELKACAPSL